MASPHGAGWPCRVSIDGVTFAPGGGRRIDPPAPALILKRSSHGSNPYSKRVLHHRNHLQWTPQATGNRRQYRRHERTERATTQQWRQTLVGGSSVADLTPLDTLP